MDEIKNFSRWIAKRFFPISIAVFALIYILWLQLTPLVPPYTSIPNNNLKSGFIFALFYIGSTGFFMLTKEDSCLQVAFLTSSVLFFSLNVWNAVSGFPSIKDTTRFNGVTYYLTYNHQSMIDTQYGGNYLAKWEGPFASELYGLRTDWAQLEFMIDENSEVVNIVVRIFDDTERLVYTDSEPPREYTLGSAQLGDHFYYVSPQCNIGEHRSACATLTYTLYRCKLDNTSCVLLPFQYTGEEDYGYLKINEANNEIDFLVESRFISSHDKSGLPIYPDILVYSYGEHPRCYVEGCEILKEVE